MDLGIQGKNALIMASSKGLGKAVAFELAKEGVNVFLCSRSQEDLKIAAQEIEAASYKDIGFAVGDVSTKEGRDHILSKAKAKLGFIDILVTNSGGPPFGTFDQHDDGAWENAYKLLLESTVGMIRGVLPDMKSNKWGRIISITSQAVKQPVARLVLSNSVRTAIVGLVKTLSLELGQYNITVNNVMPGYTQTERLEQLMKKNPMLKELTNEIPLGRIGQPNEFAAAVTFLASERASYITGVSFPVDGGWIKGV